MAPQTSVRVLNCVDKWVKLPLSSDVYIIPTIFGFDMFVWNFFAKRIVGSLILFIKSELLRPIFSWRRSLPVA